MKAALLQRTRHAIFWMAILPLAVALIAERTSSEHAALEEATLSTDDFLRNLDGLLSAVKDAETGQRGFLLTRNYDYLEPFIGAELNLDKRLSALEAIGYRNNVEPQEIQRLHRLLHRKLAELESTVEMEKQGKHSEALAQVETDQGRLDMTEILAIMDRLKDEQTRAFNRRLNEQQQSQTTLRIVLTLAIVLGFGLLVLAYRLSVLYARERDEVEAEIRQLNATLELRVQERTAELERRTRELEIRSAELQRSNADLTQFAYVASHDLQEPLRMVGSYMGLLARKYQGRLDEAADRYIQFAIDGANRMQTLIMDLLNYSRAGTQKLEIRPVHIDQVLRGALKNLELAIRESSGVIRQGPMPIVQADESKLSQVFQNLIGNAIKFRKPGTHAEIEISARRMGESWVFTVADHGIGFDPQYRNRIFDVFQRLHGIGKYPGNGIGLAICRRIVEHHGGRLWAESEVNLGSSFHFTLPATDSSGSEGEVSKSGASMPEPVAQS